MAVRNLYTYEVKTPTLDNATTLKEEYVNERFERFLREINSLEIDEKAKRFEGKLVWLTDVEDTYDSNYLTGVFKAGRYGEEQDIFDVQQLIQIGTKGINDSVISEVSFVLCKKTGLLLLESDRYRVVSRTLIDRYLGKLQYIMQDFINDHNLMNPNKLIAEQMFYTIKTILTDDFFEKLENIARIKKATVYISIDTKDDNIANHYFRTAADEIGVDGYDQIAISLVNNIRGTGIRHIKRLFENLIELEKFDKYEIEGFTHFNRQKTIHIGTQAKYFEVEVDINENGLINRPKLVEDMVEIAKKNNPLI